MKKSKSVKNYKRKLKRRKRKTDEAAKGAIDSGSVVVLVDIDIPPGAIAVLGKGFSFTPTPSINICNEQLDMRLATNNILRTASNPSYNHPDRKPGNLNKLSQKRYAAHKPAEEAAVNNIVESISNDHNGRLQFENIPSRKKNLTKDESEGLNWLIKQTREDKIAVVKADKGGALLIVDPNLLEKVVLNKLNDSNLYNLLESDPTNSLSDELFSLWLFGKKPGFISDYDAQKVMGILSIG